MQSRRRCSLYARHRISTVATSVDLYTVSTVPCAFCKSPAVPNQPSAEQHLFGRMGRVVGTEKVPLRRHLFAAATCTGSDCIRERSRAAALLCRRQGFSAWRKPSVPLAESWDIPCWHCFWRAMTKSRHRRRLHYLYHFCSLRWLWQTMAPNSRPNRFLCSLLEILFSALQTFSGFGLADLSNVVLLVALALVVFYCIDMG